MMPWGVHVARVRLGAAGAWCLAAFCLALLLAAVAPVPLGLETYSVRSGSMTPAVRTGDIIVSTAIPADQAEVGDIVTFKDPSGSGELITHRVRALKRAGDRSNFVTRGDANNAFEHWSVAADGEIGRVAYRIPLLGFPLAIFDSASARALAVVIPALLLFALGMIRIWAPELAGRRA